MFKASIETRHFSFEAYGATAEQARETLLEGCRRHAVQCGIAFESFIESHDIDVTPFALGTCYRDKHAI